MGCSHWSSVGFIDIGIPEDYARAESICHRLYVAACQKQPFGTSDEEGRRICDWRLLLTCLATAVLASF
jgi:hypothetical protein